MTEGGAGQLASRVRGSSSPQSSGCLVGNRLLLPRSVCSHAVSQDCVRELSNAFWGNASDALQMPYNLQKRHFLLLSNLNILVHKHLCTYTQTYLLEMFSQAWQAFHFSECRGEIKSRFLCCWPSVISLIVLLCTLSASYLFSPIKDRTVGHNCKWRWNVGLYFQLHKMETFASYPGFPPLPPWWTIQALGPGASNALSVPLADGDAFWSHCSSSVVHTWLQHSWFWMKALAAMIPTANSMKSSFTERNFSLNN